VVSLEFSLAGDRSRLTGVQTVAFTPDLPVTEIVFRLWPNGPQTAPAGAVLRVQRATIDGRPAPTRITAGGGPSETRGTLLRIPLDRRRPAAGRIDIGLRFTVDLPGVIADRLGHSPRTAWWASAHPMLAWVRGVGWQVDPAPETPGEGQVSEEFALRSLTVDVPTGDEVLATGEPVTTRNGAIGRTLHTFQARSVRDVAVVAGELKLVEARAAGVPIVVGLSADGVGPAGSSDVDEVVGLATRSVEDMAKRFGPFPYERLSLALIPGITGGIEYPGVILLGGQANRIVVAHEVGHEWFYGLVGNNQARDPWLDEAFATYAEALFNRSDEYVGAHRNPAALDKVGAPMSFWDARDSADYQQTVYGQGAGALLTARSRVGAETFDRAIRCYVAANAHRIARPDDLRAALAGLPAAVEELTSAGAFSR
jgi:hypothetical protein